ncbi:YceD family protein [Peterkaempfera griseoplana]|uniref:YceD family protein n=1 Tax=Peterkaempfera griseoplana TaxID=66896 RepID=UPI0007C7E443|nr:YceD family protein [Peterkaempfera griseoplana]
MFDTHELGRRPGSMRRVTRTVEAPDDFGIDVIGVPAKSPVELDIRLESVVEGVLVTGTATAGLAGECVRCLEPVEDDLEVDFQELYYYPEDDGRIRGASAAGASDEDDEEETYRLEGDLFDLQPVLRDAVVLALPLQPVCQDDCLGLCSECGARLSDDPDHHHDAVDPRWAALQGLSAAPGDEGDGNDEDSNAREGAAENQEK